MIQVEQGEQTLTFRSVFNAPRDLVFKTFSEAEHLKHWWPPAGVTMPTCTVDFRPGGEWRYSFKDADGHENFAKAVYQAIEAPAQIVYTDSLVDAEGNALDYIPSKHVTLTFKEDGDKTAFTAEIRVASAADLQKLISVQFIPGYTSGLEHLEQYLNRVRA